MRGFIRGRTRRVLLAVLAMALSLAALPMLAAPAAAAEDPMTLRSVWFETRHWNGAVPSSASSAVAIFNGLPTGSAGYCAKQVAALAGASNQGVCQGGNSAIGYHASMKFDVAVAGPWSFRLGPDFGNGGALLVDGTPIDFHSYDTWWGQVWTNPDQIFQGSINLGVGSHVFELYGFDGCCDGPWGAQLQPPGGAWTDIAGVSTTPSLRPQTIVFGSDPSLSSHVGDTYNVVTTGGASGKPVVLSLGAGAGSVCTLSGATVTRLRAGTCTILANQAGVTDIYSPAAEASQSWVAPDYAPSVAVMGVGNGATYEIHAVPAATCAVSDTEDGVVLVTPLTSAVNGPKAAFGIGAQTATCTYTDQGDNTVTTTATYAIVDTIRPTLVGAPTSAPNGAGWYNGPVGIHWTAADAGTGVETLPGDSVIDAEGAALVASATVADNAGNPTTTSSPPVAVDRTAPSTGIVAPADWQRASVSVTLQPSDNLSGVAKTVHRTDGGADQVGTSFTVSGEGDHLVEFSSVDNAGNVEAVRVVHIRIDLTSPTITHNLSLLPNGAGWHRTPVTVTFVCGDGLSGVRSCTEPVTASANGSSTVHGEAIDNAGNSSTDDAVVNVDQELPSITGVVPQPNEAGWYNGPVTVAWACGDTGGSGVASCQAPTVVGDGTDQTVSGGAGDLADNTAAASVGGLNVDTVRPTITGVVTTAVNANGWYSGDVVIHWTCTDDRSGVVACPADSTITGEGADLGASAVVVDTAGNIAVGVVAGIRIDRTAPTTSTSTGDAHFNALGWSNHVVSVTLTGNDGLSGVGVTLASVDGGPFGTYMAPIVLGDGIHLVTFRSVDAAGNQESAGSIGVKVDTTDPVVTYTGATSYTVDQTVSIHCTASDTLSGLASTTCVDVQGSATGFNPGDNTRSATATDNAGNVRSKSVTFRVTATFDSLCTLSVRYADGALGNSLCAKLNAAESSAARGNTKAKGNQLDAYRNEVRAQSGKKLTVAEAATLIRLSNLL